MRFSRTAQCCFLCTIHNYIRQTQSSDVKEHEHLPHQKGDLKKMVMAGSDCRRSALSHIKVLPGSGPVCVMALEEHITISYSHITKKICKANVETKICSRFFCEFSDAIVNRRLVCIDI